MYNRYYQEELTILRDLGREFAEAHPDSAHFLGERGSDPDVERLLEGFAFLSGRLRQKLDDELPELTHSLMGLLWPHYLRPIPCMTMMQFTPVAGAVRERRWIPRGTEVRSVPVEGTACRFRTSSEVALDPLEVRDAAFELTAGGGSSLRLAFRTTSGVKLPQLRLNGMRIHLSGEPNVLSPVYLFLSRHLSEVEMRATSEGRAIASTALPIDSVKLGGFGEEEALLPYPTTSFPGYRLLQEYFAFPPKFQFLELTQLERLADLGAGTDFEVILRFSRQPQSSLRVGPENFQLGCTPAVNLFAHDAIPVSVEHDRTEYLLRAQGEDPAHYEIFSVDSVTGMSPGSGQTRTYPSFFSFLHTGMPGREGEAVYHHHRMKPAVVGGGTELYLSFHSATGRRQLPPRETISVKLTCTNRRIPRVLRVGDVRVATSTSPEFAQFRNIAGVTGSVPPPLGDELEWRLISHLSLNYQSLQSAESLRALLGLYNFQSLADQQAARANELRLEGIQSVETKAEDAIFRGAPVRGTHTTIGLLDDRFAGEGDLVLFANVLNEFLALYASLNSFSHLTVKGLRSGEVFQWAPRLGRQIIL